MAAVNATAGQRARPTRLFVNEPELFDNSYERYLLNKLRDELPFSEVPIKLVFRGRQGEGTKARRHGGAKEKEVET